MKILIVDDQETNRKLLRAIFHAEGLETIEAGDGEAALKMIKDGAPDAIVSDILMPNMDGYRFCKEVRADPESTRIPFIIYTGTYVSPAEEVLALRCGADKYMRKPSPAHEIVQAVRDLVATGRAEGPFRAEPVGDESILKQYSEVLIQKLEKRNLELEEITGRLTRSEEQFLQLVENIRVVFFSNNVTDNRMDYVSPYFEAIWGRSVASLYARPSVWFESIVGSDKPAVEAVLKRPADGLPFEYRVERPDGGIRWVRAQVFQVPDKSGKVRHCGYAEDVTERKKSELEIEIFSKSSVGREMRMIELKREVNALSLELGRPRRYDLSQEGPAS